MSTTYNFVCVPNGADGPETAFRNLSRAGSLAGNPPGDLSRLEVPTFLVGTLDSLMTLSDELGRVDQGIEAAVKKVERAYSDLAGAGASLSVAGQSPQAYVQQFAWDYAKFPHRRSLRDLVALVGGGVAAIDDEMRALSMALAEKAAALNDLKRKKGGSMLVGDLADSLGDGVVSQIQLLDTE
ncbi:hypothetical protein TeGR_g10551 [Tetraparma gracilis]|uniref:V-type proton ATPase subunit C n=1 Tax=Tetraparma gracilis TaxID=2962635 RepID=A0ABQ6MAP6_9STRA|nr:hypothetical protein TeGR_g10551 [Tetraparma gracilis]